MNANIDMEDIRKIAEEVFVRLSDEEIAEFLVCFADEDTLKALEGALDGNSAAYEDMKRILDEIDGDEE